MEILDDKMIAGLEALGCPRGDTALKEAGIQVEFAAQVMLHFGHFGSGVTFRVGTAPAADGKGAAKPGATPTKNSNHGLVRSYIPKNFQLTKIDKNRKPISHHENDKSKLDNSAQLTVPLSLSLREMLESAGKNGDMTITFDKKKDRLVLQYRTGKGPKGFSGKFYINLKDGKDIGRRYSRPWNEPQTDPDNPDKFLNVERPRGLDETTFKRCLELINNDFPVEYQARRWGVKTEPLMIFAERNPEDLKELLPITGDWDLLVVGHPDNLPDYAYQVFHTFPKKSDNPKEAQEQAFNATKMLLKDTYTLFEELKKKAFDKKEELNKNASDEKPNTMDLFEEYLLSIEFDGIWTQQALDSAGSITPFEFLQALMLNHAYQDKNRKIYGEKGENALPFNANIINLIQHGAENRSPYKPSDLDGKMLHFYRGIPVLTRNENELIKFYLLGDYLKNNRLAVHHGWSMEKWAPVIEKQIELGQEKFIPPETLKVYENYQLMKKALATPNLPEFDAELFEAIQHNKKNYQHIPKQLENWSKKHYKRSMPPSKVPNSILSFFGKNSIGSRSEKTEDTQRLLPDDPKKSFKR